MAAVPGRVGLPAQARGHAESLTPIITRLDPNGSLSLRALAAKLTAEGLPTPAGAAAWTAATVARVKAKLAADVILACDVDHSASQGLAPSLSAVAAVLGRKPARHRVGLWRPTHQDIAARGRARRRCTLR